MIKLPKSNFPEISMVVFVSQQKKSLYPLNKNRPPALLLIAGKSILEWFYEIGSKFGVKRVFLLVNKNDVQILYKQLEKYMEVSAPHYEIGPFTILDYDESKGISEKLRKNLIEGSLLKHSIWLDGNAVFGENFYKLFLEKGLQSGKIALTKDKTSLGIGFFDKQYLELSLENTKCVDDIYSNIRESVRSKTSSMEFKEEMEFWQINYLWNLLDANEQLIKSVKSKNEGSIEDGVTILGEVVIGKGSRIRSGSYLEGPLVIGENCDIGPNCYLRKGVSLGKDVRIGNACELKNTIVFDGTHIAHLSYVGDSIIGENCNFGAGSITGNLRLDDQTVKSEIKTKVQLTGRRKLGVIMGDNVKTAINTFFMPGVIVGNNSAIGTGVIVHRNIDSEVFVYVDQKQLSREWKIKPKKKK
jgi:NDP-sugar pyrophosphorylase family protein